MPRRGRPRDIVVRWEKRDHGGKSTEGEYLARGVVPAGQIGYLRSPTTMEGFFNPWGGPAPEDLAPWLLATRYISSSRRRETKRIRTASVRLRHARASNGPTASGRGVGRATCVHKHVKEPLCKFLNTTGPYIQPAECEK